MTGPRGLDGIPGRRGAKGEEGDAGEVNIKVQNQSIILKKNYA